MGGYTFRLGFAAFYAIIIYALVAPIIEAMYPLLGVIFVLGAKEGFRDSGVYLVVLLSYTVGFL